MKLHSFIVTLLFSALLVGCAKRGYITGGPKDTIAPEIVKSNPKNYQTNFTGKTIRIDFSEYIKIKDINKQLIISPPMAKKPNITPQGSASKYIAVEILDSLKPNTTYSFNFGQSITDYNEGNPYSQFKYVFSTGNYVDSLKVIGKVEDAFEEKTEDFVNIMLYEATTFKDSTIYKDVPVYVTNTLEKNTSFSLENIKEGTYYIAALKDKNNDFKFQAKSEKIAFLKEPIKLPSKEQYTLKLFKEKQSLKTFKPTQESNNKLFLGFEGDPKNLKISYKKNGVVEPLLHTRHPGENKDTLQLFIPKNIKDSIAVLVERESYSKTYNVKINNLKEADSLLITLKDATHNTYKDLPKLKTSTPLKKINESLIHLIRKDSSKVSFSTKINVYNQEVELVFDKEENENYTLKIYPNAFEDIYDTKNDSLKFTFASGQLSDYGNLNLRLKNCKKFPFVVELLADDKTVVGTAYCEKETSVFFEAIKPSLYTVRIYYDENKNKEWDTGNLLEKRQPELLFYMPGKIDVRANWDVDQEFELTN